MKLKDINSNNPLENVRHDYTPTFAGVVRARSTETQKIQMQRIFRPFQIVMKSGRGLLLRQVRFAGKDQLVGPMPLGLLAENMLPVALVLPALSNGDELEIELENDTEKEIAFLVEFQGRSIV